MWTFENLFLYNIIYCVNYERFRPKVKPTKVKGNLQEVQLGVITFKGKEGMVFIHLSLSIFTLPNLLLIFSTYFYIK